MLIYNVSFLITKVILYFAACSIGVTLIAFKEKLNCLIMFFANVGFLWKTILLKWNLLTQLTIVKSHSRIFTILFSKNFETRFKQTFSFIGFSWNNFLRNILKIWFTVKEISLCLTNFWCHSCFNHIMLECRSDIWNSELTGATYVKSRLYFRMGTAVIAPNVV